MTDITKIPFHGTTIVATEIDGVPHVAVKPVCEAIGLDYSAQYRRIHRQPWATVAMMTTVGADGKNRDMTFLSRKSFPMWLATIDTARIKDESARELIIAFQREAADVLDKYYSEGGVINPRASEHQVNALIRQSQMQMELLQAAKGLVHPDHLEAKARIVLAHGLGEKPELEETRRPLYTQKFLREKNLSKNKMKSIAPMFGKRMKAAYMLEHGTEPGKAPLELGNGRIIDTYAYTEADRPIFNTIWDTYYAQTAAA